MSSPSAHPDTSGKVHQVFLDCTLRDGGYYNDWDFPPNIINKYLAAMDAVGVNTVELGFRFWHNEGFKGACAFTRDEFLHRLEIPGTLKIGVMVNAADLVVDGALSPKHLETLFPVPAAESPVGLVRIACHVHEFHIVLPASIWLRAQGYTIGFNLMQIADCTEDEVRLLAATAAEFSFDVLYFADSMGGMTPDQTAKIISWLRSAWSGALGIHTHDNLGLALSNTLRALDEGVTWVDATVTGMGRGPGNARTEELAIEMAERRNSKIDMTNLMSLHRSYFKPLQARHGWGTNPYYYLAGKYGIHSTFIQEMLKDSRYNEEDIFGVIAHLREEGGKKFSFNSLDGARHFYRGAPRGTWEPATIMKGREILILGTGPGVRKHHEALVDYIRRAKPLVLALNTQSVIDAGLIDLRIACHPVRLLADCEAHITLPQPLITPASMLPDDLRTALAGKELLDYGLGVESGNFSFEKTFCIAPTSLVAAYALAVATSGLARRILIAGFDGYPAGDPRNKEMESIFINFSATQNRVECYSITPTLYQHLELLSIYGL